MVGGSEKKIPLRPVSENHLAAFLVLPSFLSKPRRVTSIDGDPNMSSVTSIEGYGIYQAENPNNRNEILISFPDSALAGNQSFIQDLTKLINNVYIEGESEFWKGGKIDRCQPDEVRGLVGSGDQLAVAWRQGSSQTEVEDIAGCLKVHMVDEKTATFGILISAAAYREKGVGRKLVQFAEGWAKQHGAVMMRMELLFANGWHHPLKTRLGEWYERAGYRLVRAIDMAEMYPDLAALLAKPCDLRVYQKPL